MGDGANDIAIYQHDSPLHDVFCLLRATEKLRWKGSEGFVGPLGTLGTLGATVQRVFINFPLARSAEV